VVKRIKQISSECRREVTDNWMNLDESPGSIIMSGLLEHRPKSYLTNPEYLISTGVSVGILLASARANSHSADQFIKAVERKLLSE
jgi:hypothetical protein